ncbi:alanine--tRNA ligase-related protein [Streptomyces wuyuanensis]|uniref:alanine--tRNA ligase-related protein n=1 Tax=Streptomyces wuyuanensis TaxID=1196353 RepID=UPI0037AC3FC8
MGAGHPSLPRRHGHRGVPRTCPPGPHTRPTAPLVPEPRRAYRRHPPPLPRLLRRTRPHRGPQRPLPTPDPTLLFVNAGTVPFKPYLTGESPAPWPRATSVQKCVRTLDIEEVGRTTRHAARIGVVAVTSEASVGAGMRRLEAAVGIEGFGYLARERDLVGRIAEQIQSLRVELPDRIAALLERLKATDRENQRLKQQATLGRAAELAAGATEVSGARVVTATTDEGTDAARALAMAVRDGLPAERPGVVAVGAHPAGSGTAVLVVTVNPAAREAGQDAAALVKRLLHGRGGGSPEPAQGGGLPAGQLAKALASVPGLITRA